MLYTLCIYTCIYNCSQFLNAWMTQKLLWFNVFTKHRFELQPELTVYEKSTYKQQNVISCQEAGKRWKVFISVNLYLMEVFTAFYIQYIYTCGLFKELKSSYCICRCIPIQRTHSINMYDEVTEGCSWDSKFWSYIKLRYWNMWYLKVVLDHRVKWDFVWELCILIPPKQIDLCYRMCY